MLCYKLRKETLAVLNLNDRPVAITILPDTILTVPGDFANYSRFVKADWEGKTALVFAVDLLERGELLKVHNV
jgi:hypothetical protein